MQACIYLDFEVDEILFLQNLQSSTSHKTYRLNGITFQGDKDQYHILKETDIPNTKEAIALIDDGFLYSYYNRYGLPYLYSGYWTNRLGLNNLIQHGTLLKAERTVGVDIDTGKKLIQSTLF